MCGAWIRKNGAVLELRMFKRFGQFNSARTVDFSWHTLYNNKICSKSSVFLTEGTFIMMFSTETKTGKLLAALKSGEQLTEAQIRARFGLKNPRASVSDLRYSGFAVYANRHVDTKGRETTKYRLGQPSRAVIAAGMRALGGMAA